MTIWITSDHHFGHKNIKDYCNRPFESTEEMDDVLIQKWNSTIKANDLVYHLGDFCFGGYKNAEIFLSRLKGRIKFIRGNHDTSWFNKLDVEQKLSDIFELKLNKELFVLSHYPLLSWNKSYYGSTNCHGHTHGTIGKMGVSTDNKLPNDGKRGIRIDVGVDTNNFFPYSIEEILERVRNDHPKND